LYLGYTAEKAAELLGLSARETAALTAANGRRFFGISPSEQNAET
jgi:Tat protein secretion system quality control protein TatD with DNase activity